MNLVVSELTPALADNTPCPMDIKLSERKTSDLKVRKTELERRAILERRAKSDIRAKSGRAKDEGGRRRRMSEG